MRKKNLTSLSLNKRSISNLLPKTIGGQVGIDADGSMANCSEVMSCYRPTEIDCPPPPPASYTYCVPNNGPCLGQGSLHRNCQ